MWRNFKATALAFQTSNVETVIKLKRLLNIAVQIITKTFSKDKISQHYCHLKILKVDDLYKFEVAKLRCISLLTKRYKIYSVNISHTLMIFLNMLLVILLIIIYIFRNFPPTGLNDRLNM